MKFTSTLFQYMQLLKWGSQALPYLNKSTDNISGEKMQTDSGTAHCIMPKNKFESLKLGVFK